jgi:pyruvate-formate lyase-activating enzyme
MRKHVRHKILTEMFGENFCSSPWNSFHEGPQGLVSTCCKTRVPIGFSTKEDYKDMYNSEHAKDTRAKFLRGERPSQCKNCWVQESDGKPALNRLHGNDMSTIENMYELVNATDADGTLHDHRPEWLDLLWTSKCNFACLGCSPDLSSTINNKYKKEFAVLHGRKPDDYYTDMTVWDNGGDKKIDYIMQHQDTIRSIHLNGGEPFMQPETYDLLELLLKKGLHKKIQIWSHTNGSITKSYKGKDIIEDYLVHWGDNAKITMSMDGFGSVGEYTRYGYKDKKWLETYAKARDAGVKLTIQTCWNMFNAPNIHETGQWLLDNCKWDYKNDPPFDKPDGSLTIWTDETVNTSMLWYVPELAHMAIDSLKKMRDDPSNPYPTSWYNGIPRWIDWMEGPGREKVHKERYTAGCENDWYLESWYKGIVLMDRKRGTSLCDSVPLLTPLYQYAQERFGAVEDLT